MSVRLIRINQHVVLAGRVLTLVAIGIAPLYDGYETADLSAAGVAPAI
jgi:hypothetical protein